MTPRLRPPAFAAVLAATAVVLLPTPALAATPTITEFPVPTAGANLTGITTGSDGNLWFTEGITGGGRIGTITPSGNVTEIGLTPSASRVPFNITGGPDGNLWFTEYDNNSIGRMTPAGVFTEFAVTTPGSRPQGITTGPDRNIWFTEAVGNKIGKMTTLGAVTEYTIPTANSNPTDIVSGSDGNLWFTEGDRDKIGRITTAGVITEFDSTNGILPGPINGITAGADGALWFTQGGTPGSDRIGRISTTGVVQNFNAGLPSGSSPTDITAAQDGNLWFTMFGGSQIGRITPSGVIDTFGFAAGMTPGAQPFGIAAGPDGNLWFAEYATDKIGRINTALDPPAYSNSAAITIADNTTANPYPSNIAVTGLANRRITGVSARLTGVSHSFPDDIDVLLASPSGGTVSLMSDVGGNIPQNGVTLNLSDSQAASLPDSRPLVSGLFKPTDIGTETTFQAPAPAGPYGTSFANLNGTNPTGTWTLFVRDDLTGDTGRIAGGWGLDIATEAVPIPTVSSVTPASPANDNSPKVIGTAEAGSTVNLYSNATCSSALLGSGPRADYISTGITAAVADDSTTTIYAAITDSNGNVSACSAASVTYVEDSAPPNTPFVASTTPASPANDNAPKATGSAELGSTVKLYDNPTCAGGNIGSGTAATFSSPGIAATVADNSTTMIRATATDAAGNTSPCSAPRTYVEDSAAPSLSIDSGPSGTIDTRTAQFSFSASELVTFSCKLDTDPAAPCTSPSALAGLADGSHTFTIGATDASGNTAVPVSRTFVVNATPVVPPVVTPDTTITKKPKAKLKAKKKVKVAFEFSSSVAGSTFECALDKAAPAPCSSPKTYKVGKGKHTFSVTASAAGKKDATPATYSFQVKKKKAKKKR